MCPKLSFRYLKSTFVLSNLQKLGDALLICCKSDNFPNQVPNETDPLGTFLK
uniref:Uncharacterized protein n=1 Tax=Arundo donax TaxID=35708 RepID=A0A0A9DY07_ARUDO